MTDIDTAAIRAGIDEAWAGKQVVSGVDRMILNLCDALDDARAERDGSKIREQMRLADWREQRDRAEAAEARIAAALAIIDKSGACTVWKIRAALTGGQTDG